MKLWITKPWSPWDLGILKLCCLLIGVVLGAYFSVHLQGHLEALLGAAILLAIWPTWHYFVRDM